MGAAYLKAAQKRNPCGKIPGEDKTCPEDIGCLFDGECPRLKRDPAWEAEQNRLQDRDDKEAAKRRDEE